MVLARALLTATLIVSAGWSVYGLVGASATTSLLFWPTAGIALGALLLWGGRLWPAVWLGEFALLTAFGSFALEQPMHRTLAAACVASGAVLQALAGYWMVRRAMGQLTLRLHDPRDILRFFLLAGPLPSMLSATARVLPLLAFERLSWAVMPKAWLAAWTAGFLSVLVFAPLMLALFAADRSLWKQRRLSVAAPVAASLVLAMIALGFTLHAERNRVQAEFDSRAAIVARAIERHVDEIGHALSSVHHLFLASDSVSRADFATFTSDIPARQPEIRALQWLPRVTHLQRPAFERFVQSQGWPDFRIRERAEGGLVPAAAREVYYPVLYSEPMSGNEAALGFDSMSNPVSREGKERALASGRPSVSAVLRLVQEPDPGLAVLLAVPIDVSRAGHSQDWNERGLVQAVIVLPALIEQALRGLAAEGLELSLLDLDVAPNGALLHRRPAAPHDGIAPLGFDRQPTALSHRIAMADRTWAVRIEPTPGFVARHASPLPELMLFGGMLFTTLLTVYLLHVTGQTESVRTLVAQRTQELQDSERRYRSILDNVNAFVYVNDREGKYLYANQRLCDFFGTTPDGIVGRTDFDFFDEPTARMLHENDRRVLDFGMTLSDEEPATVDGERRIFWSRKVPLRDAAGHVYALLGITTDITDVKRAQEELRVAAQVFSQAQEGIFITDPEGVIIDVNAAFCGITGYSREDVLGRPLALLMPAAAHAAMWDAVATQGQWRGEVALHKKDTAALPAMLSLSTICDEQQRLEKVIGVFSDITLIKQQQQAMEALAYYDALTQLPNRVLFADRFARAMARARRDKRLLAVCYSDLDGFKQVNDTYGHETGDALLIEVAERFRQTLRGDDTVSRLGGDEFAFLLGDLETEAQCRLVIERIQRAIATPYRLQGHDIVVGISTGITLYPQDEGDADTLLRHADQAMYRAKLGGRNRYCFFEPSLAGR